MTTFESQKSYKFGYLKAKSPPMSPLPEFLTKPSPITTTGMILKQLGVRNLNEYILKNPHRWNPAKGTIYAYLINMQTGEYEYIGEGNPMPSGSDEGLRDGVNPYSVNIHNPPQENSRYINTTINKMEEFIADLKFQVTQEKEETKNWQRKFEDLRDKYLVKEMENTRLVLMLEDAKKACGLYENQLADAPKDNQFMRILENFSNQPAIAEKIASLIGGGQQQAQQPQPPQPQIISANGLPLKRNGTLQFNQTEVLENQL